MINECLKQKRPFGIVRTKEEGFVNVGCTAEIINVLKTYSDGRMNILAEGQKRFEVLQINQERSFLQAEVFYLVDDDENDLPLSAEQEKAVRLHGEIMQLAGAQPERTEISSGQLAYRLDGSLPFGPDFQQALLDMTSDAESLLPRGRIIKTFRRCFRLIAESFWSCAAMSFPLTLGELRRSPFSEEKLRSRRVKDELRDNLIAKLGQDGPIFPGIVGYDDTVVAQIVNAIVSRDNFIHLGLRCQADSRVLRALTCLRDVHMPY